MTFNQWMKAVDNIIVSKTGVSVHDLPDWLWRDAYQDELTPMEAVETAADYLGIAEFV